MLYSHKKHWFTLVEMILVVFIIGILSVLLFRTLGDMTRISGRIQFEKIIAKNLITIHTTTNYLAEQYPHINMSWYTIDSINQGYTKELHLIANNKTDTASLTPSGDNIYLKESKYPWKTIWLINQNKLYLTGVMFKILPIEYNTWIINLPLEKVSAEWFWMFGTLYTNKNNNIFNNINLNIQHFVHLKK